MNHNDSNQVLLTKYNHFSKQMVHPMNLNATSNPQVSRMMPNVTS